MKRIISIFLCFSILFILIPVNVHASDKLNNSKMSLTYKTILKNEIDPLTAEPRLATTRKCNGNNTIYYNNGTTTKVNYTFYATIYTDSTTGKIYNTGWSSDRIFTGLTFFVEVFAMVEGYPNYSNYVAYFKPVVGEFNVQHTLQGSGFGGTWEVNSPGGS